MKVLITDRFVQQGIDVLLKAGLVVDVKLGLTEHELRECISCYDGLIIRSATRVTEAVIRLADRLKVIGRAGAGVDNIDVAAATQRGILVMNTPGGNSVSVAEHTLGLMLALVRQLVEANQSMKGGRWEKGRFTGRELRAKVLGLIGLGKVGQEVARRARSLGMKIMAYDPFISERLAQDLDVQLVSLDELFQCSDIISLHATLNEQTRAIINRQSLQRMKDGVLIINCSRGELVDEEALLEGIKTGKVYGAGLDVFVGEPSPMRELVEHPRVIATPHIAASTQEAQEQVCIDIAEQVRDYLLTGQIRNAVNFPTIQPEEAEKLRVFCQLGEKLGKFIAQMSDRRLHEVGIRYYGKINELNTYPISNAVLSGVLKPALGDEVNMINARRVAEERRLIVTETKSGRTRSLSNVISVQLRDGQGGVDWVEGAVFKQNHLRLVTIDGIDLEVPLSRFMLLMQNQDVPGVIGRIGTILGAANINIANFALGRQADAPLAIGVLTVDSEVSESVLTEIRQSSGITKVRFINLD
ncbi:MAG: phosphoglycerate dehydrogenase [Acidobacteriota bacterium]|nr:phosphoglycerate dehydrogenase [Blastocatellia bacterium]MDW8238194.1 phosphoglycerate dehydrogenase [Acidobacteriota bacterium]